MNPLPGGARYCDHRLLSGGAKSFATKSLLQVDPALIRHIPGLSCISLSLWSTMNPNLHGPSPPHNSHHYRPDVMHGYNPPSWVAAGVRPHENVSPSYIDHPRAAHFSPGAHLAQHPAWMQPPLVAQMNGSQHNASHPHHSRSPPQTALQKACQSLLSADPFISMAPRGPRAIP